MDIIKLIVVFITILAVMKLNKPLYISILSGSLVIIFLYKLNLLEIINSLRIGAFGISTINLILAFYSITFLQRMLEHRNHLMLAEESLTNLFNSRRINTMVAPFVIGLLPSPSAVLIAAPIVDNATSEFLDLEERTFVTSFYRHISESFLPTYASIILAINLSRVDMTQFVISMIPMVLLLFILGYIFYVRKIPKSEKPTTEIDKKQEFKNLIKSLWTIVVTIFIILMFKIQVHFAVLPVILISYFLNKFDLKEVLPMFKSAFETKLVLTTIAIMVFKELLTQSGIIEELPQYFSMLAVSPVIIFGLIFFFGTLVAGSQGMIALALPLAYATLPNGGLALMVFLMNVTYIAMQISPTHICLAIITEENQVSFISLVRKTLPVLISFLIVSSAYSYLLYLFL